MDVLPSDVQDQFDNDKLASPSRFTRLSLPRRGGACIQTVSNTSNDSSNDHLRNAKSRDLQQGANTEDCCSQQNRLFSSDHIAQEVCCDGSEEAPNVVDGRDCPQEGAVVAVKAESATFTKERGILENRYRSPS